MVRLAAAFLLGCVIGALVTRYRANVQTHELDKALDGLQSAIDADKGEEDGKSSGQ